MGKLSSRTHRLDGMRGLAVVPSGQLGFEGRSHLLPVKPKGGS